MFSQIVFNTSMINNIFQNEFKICSPIVIMGIRYLLKYGVFPIEADQFDITTQKMRSFRPIATVLNNMMKC